VSQSFYRDFDTHRKAPQVLDGIGEVADREWYASVMLTADVRYSSRQGLLEPTPITSATGCKRLPGGKGEDKFYTSIAISSRLPRGVGKRRKDRALTSKNSSATSPI